jgi:hypothetical protein
VACSAAEPAAASTVAEEKATPSGHPTLLGELRAAAAVVAVVVVVARLCGLLSAAMAVSSTTCCRPDQDYLTSSSALDCSMAQAMVVSSP